jgi:hypothetical protein
MKQNVSLILMERILDLVRESGANQREAESAIKAALAMLPEMDLEIAPTFVIET